MGIQTSKVLRRQSLYQCRRQRNKNGNGGVIIEPVGVKQADIGEDGGDLGQMKR